MTLYLSKSLSASNSNSLRIMLLWSTSSSTPSEPPVVEGLGGGRVPALFSLEGLSVDEPAFPSAGPAFVVVASGCLLPDDWPVGVDSVKLLADVLVLEAEEDDPELWLATSAITADAVVSRDAAMGVGRSKVWHRFLFILEKQKN